MNFDDYIIVGVDWGTVMKGTVVRVVSEKGYGFIKAVSQGEYFFHRSDFSGFWDDLVKDMQGRVEVSVSFEAVESNKGLRAANVRRTDHPNAA